MVERDKIPEELPGRTMLKRNITSQRALEEFKIAVEIWFRYMDEATKREALAIVHARGKRHVDHIGIV